MFFFSGFILIQFLLHSCKSETKQVLTNTPFINYLLKVEATISRQKILSHLPSASGMEVINNNIYIIGDDSPLLYQLHLNNWESINSYPLFKSDYFSTGRIPKALKPDLECLTSCTYLDQTYLLSLGSGSTPIRTTGYVIQIPQTPNANPVIQPILITHLYETFLADSSITINNKLNIEAVATSTRHLYLLQRSVNNGPHSLITFPLIDFMNYLLKPQNIIPEYSVRQFTLPEINKRKASFTGASYFDNKLFITASVENTDDAYLDGEVLGSFVGFIDVNFKSNVSIHLSLLADSSGNIYTKKVESISLISKKGNDKYIALAVTDNDNGQSELLELVLNLSKF